MGAFKITQVVFVLVFVMRSYIFQSFSWWSADRCQCLCALSPLNIRLLLESCGVNLNHSLHLPKDQPHHHQHWLQPCQKEGAPACPLKDQAWQTACGRPAAPFTNHDLPPLSWSWYTLVRGPWEVAVPTSAWQGTSWRGTTSPSPRTSRRAWTWWPGQGEGGDINPHMVEVKTLSQLHRLELTNLWGIAIFVYISFHSIHSSFQLVPIKFAKGRCHVFSVALKLLLQ